MPQLRTLDVSGLVNRGDIDEVYQTFPNQRLCELKIETFGLQRLCELTSGDSGFLQLVQSIHCTMNGGSYFTNDAMIWLMGWVGSGQKRRRRLTFVFPSWDKSTHNRLILFLDFVSTMGIVVGGLNLLHIVIRDVDVAFVATINNDALSRMQNPFLVFCDANTNVRIFIQTEDMDVSTAGWLSIMAMPLTHIAAVETVVWLHFTDRWDPSHPNLFALTRTTGNLVRYHVIKALRTLPIHYTNDCTYDAFSDLSRGESRIQIKVCGLDNHRPSLSRIPTEEHIRSQMTRYGYIQCTM
jgi:hypothetical protein